MSRGGWEGLYCPNLDTDGGRRGNIKPVTFLRKRDTHTHTQKHTDTHTEAHMHASVSHGHMLMVNTT